jgi:hypothetical protein
MLMALQPFDNLIVHGADGGKQVQVGRLRFTVAADAIAISSVADRYLLSGVIQTSHFKGVRTVFDPKATSD